MEPMYRGIPFSPQTTLTDSIGAADTIIPVADVSAFPDPPNYATIGIDADGETISYAAKTDNALSGCTRGVEGTPKSWASGSVIARNFTAKDLESLQKNLREVGRGVQSSWSQNDPDEADFIKDKTHWAEVVSPGVVLIDAEVEFISRNADIPRLPETEFLPGEGPELVEGTTYIVTWNSVKYECVAKRDGYGACFIGNEYLGNGVNDTGEPFFIDSYGSASYHIFKATSDVETISIKVQTKGVVIYHKLDHEFLPDGSPYAETAKIGQTIVVSEVDADGKPTRWEAVEFPAGGGDEEWELIVDYTVPETVNGVTIDKDLNGNPFELKRWRVITVYFPVEGVTTAHATQIGFTSASAWGHCLYAAKPAPTASETASFSVAVCSVLGDTQFLDHFSASTSNSNDAFNITVQHPPVTQGRRMNEQGEFVSAGTTGNATCIKICGYQSGCVHAGSIVKMWGVRA